MVAKDGHLLVRRVILALLLLSGALLCVLEQSVQSDGSVVRTEHLDGEALHETLQVRVHRARINQVEHVLIALLALAHALECCEHLQLHLVFLLIPNRVLTQEIKLHRAWLGEKQVPDAQRAAPHRVRQVVVLLPARAQRQLVNQIHCHRHLHHLLVLGGPVLLVVLADAVDVVLELARLLVFLEVTLALDGALRRKLHVLPVLGVDGVAPARQPRHAVVVHHLPPLVPRQRAHRHRVLFTYVDGDVLWVDARLELAHLGVLASAPEQPRRLHPEIAHALLAPVDGGIQKLLLLLILLRLDGQLLLLGHVLLLLSLLEQVQVDGREVTLGDVLHEARVLGREHAHKVLPKILDKHRLGGVVGVLHHREHARHLLLCGAEVHGLIVVPHLDAMGLVRRGEEHAHVLQRLPQPGRLGRGGWAVAPLSLLRRLQLRLLRFGLARGGLGLGRARACRQRLLGFGGGGRLDALGERLVVAGAIIAGAGVVRVRVRGPA
mmetsp:Transcript_43671/g.83339  ORF Transcript_43671/g.83339 Transcript_43671/m.83339 type:complete len:493 (-) Transcript_43671:238-1716(-)